MYVRFAQSYAAERAKDLQREAAAERLAAEARKAARTSRGPRTDRRAHRLGTWIRLRLGGATA